MCFDGRTVLRTIPHVPLRVTGTWSYPPTFEHLVHHTYELRLDLVLQGWDAMARFPDARDTVAVRPLPVNEVIEP